jgi:hypothetical protein
VALLLPKPYSFFMKRIIFMSAAVLLAAPSTQAQFLNKLKQKAQQAVSKAIDGKAGTGTGSNVESDATNSSTAPFPHEAKSTFNPEQFGRLACNLQPDERVVYGEHSLDIVNNQALVKVITHNKSQYFLYENDKRSGPFKTPPVEQLGNWRNSMNYYDSGNDDKRTEWQPYVTKGILTVDGKSYGEVMSMGSFYHNKAKKKFYGVALRLQQMKPSYHLVSHTGSREVPFVSGDLYVSDNDELGGLMITATQFNAKTNEERMKFLTNDDFYIVLSNGKNLGPFPAVQANKSYLDNAGNFIQISAVRKAVFVNGKPAFTFPDHLSGEGRFYMGSTGKSGAWFERGSLYFTDGTSIVDYVIQPTLSTENGKAVINWLTLHNHKLYVCKKEL